MANIKLRLVRKFNKIIRATLGERIFIERLFKDNAIYDNLEIPDRCFKSHNTYLAIKKW